MNANENCKHKLKLQTRNIEIINILINYIYSINNSIKSYSGPQS